MKCEMGELRDGSLWLELGDGAEECLLFGSGCMRGDPDLERQRALLKELVKAWEFYEAARTERVEH